MSAAARPAWSVGQRDRLAAMGLELYVRADVDAVAGTGRPRRDAPTGDAASPGDALLRALLRAAGVQPGGADAEAVTAMLPALDDIRGNPAAKRALWPRLRALRRTRRR